MGKDQYYMLVSIVLAIVVAGVAFVLIGGLFDQNEESEPTTPNQTNEQAEESGETEASSQVQVEVLEEGTGDVEAQNGDQLVVHYSGHLNDKDGAQFDSSYNRNEPFPIVLGESSVIQGWHQGLQGVKQGDLVGLTIPPELGYGVQGNPPDIPPNATLYFEIRVVELNTSQESGE